jgi:hypothetical protein
MEISFLRASLLAIVAISPGYAYAGTLSDVAKKVVDHLMIEGARTAAEKLNKIAYCQSNPQSCNNPADAAEVARFNQLTDSDQEAVRRAVSALAGAH